MNSKQYRETHQERDGMPATEINVNHGKGTPAQSPDGDLAIEQWQSPKSDEGRRHVTIGSTEGEAGDIVQYFATG